MGKHFSFQLNQGCESGSALDPDEGEIKKKINPKPGEISFFVNLYNQKIKY
jgi:hypothetical protein